MITTNTRLDFDPAKKCVLCGGRYMGFRKPVCPCCVDTWEHMLPGSRTLQAQYARSRQPPGA